MLNNMNYIFKAKPIHTDDNEFVFGDLVHRNNLNSNRCFISLGDLHECPNTEVEVDPKTVCPCTNVQDCTGKWIYLHDIVEYDDGQYKFKGEVVFEAGAYGVGSSDIIKLDLKDSCACDNFVSFWELLWNSEDPCSNEVPVSVIGNIFDNKELI